MVEVKYFDRETGICIAKYENANSFREKNGSLLLFSAAKHGEYTIRDEDADSILASGMWLSVTRTIEKEE